MKPKETSQTRNRKIMKKITGDEPIGIGDYFDDEGERVESKGITKREYFAAKALQGLWASTYNDSFHNYEIIAKMSVLQADALIAELNKNEGEE